MIGDYEKPIEPDIKHVSDGVCGICGDPVPEYSLNKFYCSEECMYQARKYYNECDE